MPDRYCQSNQGNNLTKLTCGLERVATLPLHIYTTDDIEHLKIHCQFGGMVPDCMQQLTSINKVDVYITGDPAFQATALGRVGMSPHHFLHCKMGRSEFKNIGAIGLPWTMKEYIEVGQQSRESCNSQLGVKKEPWWQFIPLDNYMVPLLHMLNRDWQPNACKILQHC
jgi:hypothetical protein